MGRDLKEPLFFASPAEFRKWLAKNHEKETELLVGFHKRATGKPSMTWPESVDQALAFGWIDGVRRRIDDERYSIRFTPRKKGSNWSAINIRRVAELTKLGLMEPAGLRAFEQRREDRSAVYEYENAPRQLPPEYEAKLRKNKKAWEYYQSEAPWYRRITAYWVVSAKKEETRLRRLEKLIEDSAAGRRIAGVLEKKR